jgi:hypothetical protein
MGVMVAMIVLTLSKIKEEICSLRLVKMQKSNRHSNHHRLLLPRDEVIRLIRRVGKKGY